MTLLAEKSSLRSGRSSAVVSAGALLRAGAVIAGVLIAAIPATAAEAGQAAKLSERFVTSSQCAATLDTVWVVIAERGFCIKYTLSEFGGHGPRPVVYFGGDQSKDNDPGLVRGA